ncbi:MAG TPA: hypothetical protein PK961_17690 [bacterium]|nr:hypothetical protein [bacterium]
MENDLFQKIRSFFDRTTENAEAMNEALMVIEPVPPYGGRGMVTVLITAAGLISIALLGGMGLVSMMVLLITLALIFLILAKVFGISFDMDPTEIFGFHPGGPF